jgi:NifB/MoaA-like Fe-S oxidoreductase
VKVRDRESINEIVSDLNALGFHVERVMKRVGVVGGRGPACLAREMATVPGVELVREEGSFQLPPLHGALPQ